MKVPLNPTTRTVGGGGRLAPVQVSGISADAFGMGIAKALQGLGASITSHNEKLERAQLFDVKRRTIRETTDAQIDLQRRMNEAPLGADNFTADLRADYEARHQQMIDEAIARGESQQAVEALTLSLDSLRNSMIGQGITFEGRSNEARVKLEVDDIGSNLARIVAMNPDEMPAAIEELNEVIDLMPKLSAFSKEALKQQAGTAIKMAAGLGLAQQNPRAVMDALTVGGSGPEAYREAIASLESRGSGDYSAIGPTHPRLGRALGRYQIMEANIGPWSQKHLGRRVSVAEFMANEDIQDAIFDGEFGEYVEKYGLEGAAQAWFGGTGSVGKTGRKDVLGTSVGGYGQKFLQALGQTTAPKDGLTGNPILDALDPAQRNQVLSAARTEYNRKMVESRGWLEATQANAEVAFMTTGEYDGPKLTKEDFMQSYNPREAEQKWAAFQTTQLVGEHINRFKTQSPGDIAAQVEALRPTDTASPTYALEQKAYETAVKAQQELLKQRAADPAGYAARHFPSVAAAWQEATSSGDEEAQMLAYKELHQAYEQLGIRPAQRMPIPDSLVEPMKEALKEQTPEQRIDTLTKMRNAMGPMYNNGLAQLAKQGMPVEAHLAGLVLSSPEHKTVAANVLRGMEIIEADPSRKPAYEQVNEIYREEMGTAVRSIAPEASAAILQAATALYVFKGGDPKYITPDDFSTSLREVLGGTAEDPSTGIYDFGGWGFFGESIPTILPAGVNAEEFSNWVEELTPESLAEISSSVPMTATGEPMDVESLIDEGRFIRTGADEYIVVMTSDGKPVIGSDGQYFRVTITPEDIRARVSFGPITYEDDNGIPAGTE